MSGEGKSLVCGTGKKAHDWRKMLVILVKEIKELMYDKKDYTEVASRRYRRCRDTKTHSRRDIAPCPGSPTGDRRLQQAVTG